MDPSQRPIVVFLLGLVAGIVLAVAFTGGHAPLPVHSACPSEHIRAALATCPVNCPGKFYAVGPAYMDYTGAAESEFFRIATATKTDKTESVESHGMGHSYHVRGQSIYTKNC